MKLTKFLLVPVIAVPACLFSMDVIVHIPEKGAAYLRVPPEEALINLRDSAENLLARSVPSSERGTGEEVVEVMFAEEMQGANPSLPQSPPGVRDYHFPVTEQNAKDIRYIVTTLANKPPVKLLFYKSSLDRAGDRIDHVHPFRFLQVIFTDEELKVGIRNIRRKGWVWKEFIGGLKDSLNDEYVRDNLYGFIDDFSINLGIDPELIRPSIYYRHWDELVKVLIENVPREGNADRYDI